MIINMFLRLKNIEGFELYTRAIIKHKNRDLFILKYHILLMGLVVKQLENKK